MIQKARGEDSQSLLREIAYSCLVLPTETQAERDSDIYFLRQLSKVLKAQRAKQEGTLSSGCKTGAKKVRIELLEYLRQIASKQGSRVQTANIYWNNLLNCNSKIEPCICRSSVMVAQLTSSISLTGKNNRIPGKRPFQKKEDM